MNCFGIFILSSAFHLYSETFRVIHLNGIINSVSASYLKREIRKAENEAECIILEIDTPGGIMDPMREIVKEIINCRIPVIVFVSPLKEPLIS